jgi:REP element-mobilizing transposase RayT
MPIRKIKFATGEFYHIYNRGNGKQEIFHDKNDYQRFVDLLFAMNRKENFDFSNFIKNISIYELNNNNPLVAIGAYTPMPNHFHILLTPLIENGVVMFMQKISTAYSMYYNRKYKRTGGLFEGRFKARHVDNDRYLKYVFSYIHLNIQKIEKDLFNYSYSSFLDYAGEIRHQNKILNKKMFPEYFSKKETFLYEIKQWILYRQAGGPATYKKWRPDLLLRGK